MFQKYKKLLSTKNKKKYKKAVQFKKAPKKYTKSTPKVKFESTKKYKNSSN